MGRTSLVKNFASSVFSFDGACARACCAVTKPTTSIKRKRISIACSYSTPARDVSRGLQTSATYVAGWYVIPLQQRRRKCTYGDTSRQVEGSARETLFGSPR